MMIDASPAIRKVTLAAGFDPRQLSKEDVLRALRSFPLVSSDGPDGLTAQHLTVLLVNSTDDNLQQAMMDFLSLMLAESFIIVLGGRLIALSKKDGESGQYQWVTSYED